MTTEKLHYCADGGNLVGMQHWLPAHLFDYDWGLTYPQIGCNNLHCCRCTQTVTATAASESYRRYNCACTEDTLHTLKVIGQVEGYPGPEALRDPPPGTWACAGHPALTVPADLDGVHISAQRFIEVARKAVLTPPLITPNIKGHPIWLSRLYWILPFSLRTALGAAVAALVLDTDPRVAFPISMVPLATSGLPQSRATTVPAWPQFVIPMTRPIRLRASCCAHSNTGDFAVMTRENRLIQKHSTSREMQRSPEKFRTYATSRA
jgi:hypothetical protein